MGFFTPNYSAPGRGVSKNAPKKKGFFQFFELLFRKFWQLCSLSLTFSLAAFPFVLIYVALSTILVALFVHTEGATTLMAYSAIGIALLFTMYLGAGPASSGHTRVLTDFSREQPVFLWSDFFEGLKKNFGRSLCVFFIDALVIFFFSFATTFYFGNFDIGINVYIRLALGFFMLAICLIYTLMHPFIYTLITDKQMKLFEAMSLSFTMVMAKLPSVLTVFILSLLPNAIVLCLTLYVGGFFVFMVPVLMFSLTAFIMNFYAVSLIDTVFPLKKENDENTNSIFDD